MRCFVHTTHTNKRIKKVTNDYVENHWVGKVFLKSLVEEKVSKWKIAKD